MKSANPPIPKHGGIVKTQSVGGGTDQATSGEKRGSVICVRKAGGRSSAAEFFARMN